MSIRYLETLYNPPSIAVVGGSDKEGKVGHQVLANIIAGGYEGELIVVNTHGGDTVQGRKCYRSVNVMPRGIALAVVCTPAETVLRMIRKLGEKDVQVAIVVAAGMETMHTLTNRSMIESMAEEARLHNIRVLGPNAIGMISPHHHLNASYTHVPVLPGKIALVSQSGAVTGAILDWAMERKIGFSCVISVGHSADLRVGDLVEFLGSDPKTKAIILQLDRIRSPRRFISAVRMASRGKRIFAMKSGRVLETKWQEDQRVPALLNNDAIYDAIFHRAGIARLQKLDDLMGILETHGRYKQIRDEKLVVVGNGMGASHMAIDRFVSYGGELATIRQQTLDVLRRQLPGYCGVGNPLDLCFDATGERYRTALEILAQDAEVHNVLVIVGATPNIDPVAVAQLVVDLDEDSHLNFITCWMGRSNMLAAWQLFDRANVPSYGSPERAVKLFMSMINFRRSQVVLRETPPPVSMEDADRISARELIANVAKTGRNYLTPPEVRQLLQFYGISIVDGRFCADEQQVLEAYEFFAEPVSVALVHERDRIPYHAVGVERLERFHEDHISSFRALREACSFLRGAHAQRCGDSRVLGFMVRPTRASQGGISFCLGITRHDNYGPLIVCGAGGYKHVTLVDRRIALPPLNMTLAKDLLNQSHVSRVLAEYSYHPEPDAQRICETLVKISQMAINHPEIDGLEINPLLFDRNGPIAVRATVSLGEPARPVIKPYPEHLSEVIRLPKSGEYVEIRPIRGEDEPAHLRFLITQKPESLRYRFFSARRNFTHDELVQMTQIDYDREMVFVVTRPSDAAPGYDIFGDVRTWTDAENQKAEFAVMVSEKFAGTGLGSLLMDKMIRYCRDQGTTWMVGSVLPDNGPMLAMAHRLGFETEVNREEEVVDLRLALQPRE